MSRMEYFKDGDYVIPTVSKDYIGLIARPRAAGKALRRLKAALHRHGAFNPDFIGFVSWRSFRVFIPDCACHLGFPRPKTVPGKLDGRIHRRHLR